MAVTGPIAVATLRTSAVLALRLAVQAGSLMLVARILGPQQFGAFAGAAALAVLLSSLATFGTHLVLLGEMSKDPLRRSLVLPYAIPTTLVCGASLLAVFLLLCALILQGSGIGWRVLIAIGAAEMLMQPLLALAAAELLALGRTARSQLLQTLPLILRLAVAGAVYVLQPSDTLSMYGYGYCAATVVALTAVARYMFQAWPHPRQWRWPVGGELRESASFAVLNITAMGPAELDKTLATKLLPLAAAGLYAAGARIVGAVTLPVIALMLSAMPRLFREGQNQPQRTARLLRWIFLATTIYSVVLAAALWWCAPLFVWLFGDKYEGVDGVIRWLCIAVPGMALRIAAGSVLMTLGKPWMRAGFELGGLVVLVAAASATTKVLGVYGMPLALACAEWGMALLGGALVVRCFRGNSCHLSMRQPTKRAI